MSTLGILAFFVSFAAPQEPARPQAPQSAPAASTPTYKIQRTLAIGGDGGWDYVSVDDEARRLYVPRGSHVVVLDAATGKVLASPKIGEGVDGAAFDPGNGSCSRRTGSARCRSSTRAALPRSQWCRRCRRSRTHHADDRLQDPLPLAAVRRNRGRTRGRVRRRSSAAGLKKDSFRVLVVGT